MPLGMFSCCWSLLPCVVAATTVDVLRQLNSSSGSEISSRFYWVLIGWKELGRVHLIAVMEKVGHRGLTDTFGVLLREDPIGKPREPES